MTKQQPEVTSNSDIDVHSISKQFHVTNESVMEPDGYNLLRLFREQLPVFRSELYGGFHVFTRYSDQWSILRDPETFSSATVMIPELPGGGFGPPTESDPPLHAQYRRALEAKFTLASVRLKEPELRSRARDALNTYVKEGGDFIDAFCRPFPTITFMLMAGLPLSDLGTLRHLVRGILKGDPDGTAAPGLHAYLDEMLRRRQGMADAPDDLVTTIAHAQLDDRPWTAQERVLALLQVCFAGLETVTNTLGLTTWFLATHPDHRNKLVNDPSCVPAAVEEFLRYFTIETTARTATRDCVISGHDIKAGERVLLPLASAGRDAEMWEDPEAVDFQRNAGRHLAFGAGPHRCLGSHLARVELRIALHEMLKIMPNFTVRAGTAPSLHWGTVFGIEDLELENVP